METELKNQIAQSLETIKTLMARWERVREVAEDILAYVNKDTRRFRIEVGSAVGLRLIYIYVAGAERYAIYGESAGDMTIRQVFEQFYKDEKALINMVSELAKAIKEVAEDKIEELEEQIQ